MLEERDCSTEAEASPADEAASMEEVSAEEVSTEEAPINDLALIREELAALRALVTEQKRVAAEPVVTETFRALYPGIGEADIPDAVLEEARGGLPLEAAYALYERRESLRRRAAEEANRKNAGNSWGKTEGGGDGFLSPDEVRKMSPSEVHRNYQQILSSMKHWT